MNVRPAIVIVPERAGPVVAATLNVTVPFPLSLVPDLSVIHETLLFAVQLHPLAAVTETELLSPDAGTF